MKPREAYAFAASAHVGPGDRGDADPHRGLLAAPVLAGHRRRVHEVPADHADRDAVGLAGGGADLHADARRADRQAARGPSRRGAAATALYMQDRAARRSAIRASRILLALALLVGVPIALRQGRQGRRVLPQCRAGRRRRAGPRARQPLARREGPAGPLGREPHPRHAGAVDGLRPLRRHGPGRSDDVTEDVIGQIQFEFVDWQERRPAGADHGRDPRARPPTFPASRSR